MAEPRRDVAALPPDRLRLLMERLREKDRAAAPGIAPVARDGSPLPLSFAQERLWFLEQLEGGSGAYNFPVALRLRGRLEPAALAAALREIARRHEALRTTLTTVAGRPAQAVYPEPSLELPEIDLTTLPLAAGGAEAARLAAAWARRPFDLERGPLARTALIRLGAGDHLFVLAFHHAIADGGSMSVFFGELAALYAAGCEGRPSPLPPLPVQYADYAVWQRRWLAGPVLESQLAFWRDQLAGAPESLDLPTDRPRPAAQTFRGAAAAVALPPELVRAARGLAQRRSATVFMALLAAWSAVLHRWSGQEEVVIGSPVANRRPEVERVIGFFVNTLPLRAEPGGRTFAALLSGVRERALAAFAHQDVPFERLVEELPWERDLSRNPLFQVMLTLQDGPAVELRLPGVAAEPWPVDTATSKFDLTLGLIEAGGGLAGGLEYATDLFDAATARRMADHLAILLAGAVADPDAEVADLPLLAPAEARQVLADWNATAAPYPRGRGLHELFEAQAARTPDATALIWGEERLTYQELDARAGRLARRLRGLGVGPETLVGIYTHRTSGMVAALLAVMKAGGAYVPLDPAYPAERVALLLADTAAPVLISERVLERELPPYGGRVVLLEDEERDGRDSRDDRDDRDSSLVDADQIAYAIYTSGSTGLPKAVLIRHSSAVAMISWALATYPAEALAGMLASTSICFDISIFEIFAPLACGGTVILADDALALAGLPAAGEVRLIDTVPSAMAELLRAGAVPPSVRIVNLAGEPLRRDLVDKVYALPHVEEVYNLYGPSEDTTFSTVSNPLRGERREPTIGRPLTNGRVYLLDWRLRPVPVGVPGEVWIAGAGLARGYLNRPELTADRFRPDPFASGPGERLYRVGDLARYLPGGELEFLGRLDHQVKIRGFRVELGEIEAALNRHPGVREAAVIAREEGATRALLACVVPAAEETADLAAELRRHLTARLPAYMVPSGFLLLPALPLNPNGKIDRRALARLGPAGRPAAVAGPTAPRTPDEERLAGLWSELLGVAAVGVEESFFELGGHSLLAMQMVSRLRATLGVELPVRAVFENPTVAGLAGLLAAARPAERDTLLPLAVEDAPPLSFAQERLWFLDRLDGGGGAYNVPVAVRLRGPLDAAALRRACTGVASRHAPLRATFGERDGVPSQSIAPAAEVPLPVIDLAALPDERRQREMLRLATAEARTPFDLARGPLLRARLFRFSGGEHTAVLNLHHIAADGWSLGVLLRELAALYAEEPLPALSIQYADWAAWQRRRLQGETLEGELAYWRERLADAPALALPADRPRPAFQSLHGASLELALSGEETREVRALAQREGATPFMVLLAAFLALLARTTGQTDLAVGTPVANREPRETEELIGLFVNTLVLRARLAGDPAGTDLLRHVREVTLAAYAHAELPLEKIVEDLQPAREPGRNPLFQVLFALQNQPLPALRIGGLELVPFELDAATAKVDLSLVWRVDGGRLTGLLEYATALFEAATAGRLLRYCGAMLCGLLAEPRRRLSELPLLDPAERRQLVVDWNGAAAASGERCLHEVFAARAARAPEAVALLLADGGRLTYGELDRRSTRLAARLRSLGVGPEVPVGVHLERSAEVVVALLALWKAGGAYLPLDPDLPAERLAFLLADSGAPVVVTLTTLSRALPAGARTLALDAPEEPAALADIAGPAGAVATPGNLAWILYTSGSTGRPKAVAVEHRAAAAHLATVIAEWGLDGGDRVLQFASPSFDVWIEETVAPLLCGAAVVARGVDLWEPSSLLARAAAREVTVLSLPTAYWRQWVLAGADGLSPGPLPRLAVIGGEAMPAEAARAWWRSPLAGVRLLNGYGPTEAVITASFHEVGRADAEAAGGVPLGRPLPGRCAYVLDAHGLLLPAGVPGELCLGGPLLARGYLGRPGLTAERFVPDPFAGEWGGAPGARLYRTGDLARRRPDGAIEFLGRLDHQVKVRGFRIEPGEIEAALAAHPAIGAAVVLARPGSGGAPALTAYAILAAGAATPVPAELRAHVAARLPGYMVPAAFAFLDTLPLTPGGKVDRRALERIEPVAAGREAARRLPRTRIERLLANIWSELLGLDVVGIDDSFFELGGHSLLAMQVLSRLRDALGIDLPVRRVFERPTIAALAEAVAGERSGGAPPLLGSILAGEAPPLSFAQARFWFLDRLEPANPAYNIPAALRLGGRLAVPALAAALREIERRHTVLRTTFAERDGAPFQVLVAEPRLALPVIDLSGLPATHAGELALELARREGRRGFDLARGPLARAALLRLGAGEHIALFTLHHIVSDAWSSLVFTRELSALYTAAAAGLPSPLAELPCQYADYAVWQRAWLRGEELERRLRFWRQRLTPLPDPLELPADRSGPAAGAFRGGAESVLLPRELTAAAERFGAARGATPFMILLAAFQTLLGRYTHRQDFTLGTPVANRDGTELEGLIGLFLNTLVLRVDLTGDPTGEELLARVREAALDAYAHQDLPFERLVEELLPGRELARTPLFQVLFTFQSAPPRVPDLGPGVTAAFWETGAVTAKFDLSLNLAAGPEGWQGTIGYDAGRFDPPTLQRLAGHLRVLLGGMAAAPEARVSELPLLTLEESRQMTEEWGAVEPVVAERPVHELFARWVRETPTATAVVFEGRSLSYRELDERAGRLARRLRALGVGAEDRVGLCLLPSLAVVPAILGILKAGGAYVPLEPGLPAGRLAAMLADSAARALITQEDLAPSFAGAAAPVLVVDEEWRVLAGEDGGPAPEAALPGPESLAYVIYTSGSTGTPKGVMVEHRQLAAYVAGVTRRMELPAGASYALVSSVAADLGHTVLFTALATGGTLHVVARERLLHPERMAELFELHPVDCMKIVPSHLSALLASARPAGVLPRRLLVIGGEASRWSFVDRLRELAPGCRVLNHYGPTETAVGVLAFPAWDEGGRLSPWVPLGRPLPGVRLVVADRALRALPIGIPGELLVGGPQVSRGYLERPDLTAERFVPDPLTGAAGARLYRTGDLTRYRGDGNVEFLGRTDHQVKVRGFRVELGEIEVELATVPGVRSAVVLAHGDEPEKIPLVAYVVAVAGKAPAAAELRGRLAARLPAHMVPSRFVLLPELPLTANGKLDRQALARLAPEAPLPEAGFVAPRNPLEEMLAPLWSEVLGIERVGAHDDFFALGGHSLLGIRLLSRVDDLFGVRLPVRALFQSATLGEMADRIAEEMAAQAGEDLLQHAATAGDAAGYGNEESFNG